MGFQAPYCGNIVLFYLRMLFVGIINKARYYVASIVEFRYSQSFDHLIEYFQKPTMRGHCQTSCGQHKFAINV